MESDRSLPPSLDPTILFNLYMQEQNTSEYVRLNIWKRDGKTFFNFTNAPPSGSVKWKNSSGQKTIQSGSTSNPPQHPPQTSRTTSSPPPSPPITRNRKRMRAAETTSSPSNNSPELIRSADHQLNSLLISPPISNIERDLNTTTSNTLTPQIEINIPTKNRFNLLSVDETENDDETAVDKEDEGENVCAFKYGCCENEMNGCPGCFCGTLKVCKPNQCKEHECYHCPTTRSVRLVEEFMERT